MVAELKDVTAHDLYLAAERGAMGAKAVGESMIEDSGETPLECVLAALARVRFIEQGIQIGAAQMLQVSLEEVAELTKQLTLTLLLERVVHQGLGAKDAQALAGGYGTEQLAQSAQNLNTCLGVSEALAAVSQYKQVSQP